MIGTAQPSEGLHGARRPSNRVPILMPKDDHGLVRFVAPRRGRYMAPAIRRAVWEGHSSYAHSHRERHSVSESSGASALKLRLLLESRAIHDLHLMVLNAD